MAKSASDGAALAPELLTKYEPVIGLEVHVQLLTKTKIFCGCSTRFGDPPNTNVCPVCLGLPGTLPVLNKRAVEMAMRASLALHCTVQERSRFARKNYFYPDLPKGYQISQYELPLATQGWLEIDHDGAKKRIGITRLHLEEDAGKLLHEGFPQSANKTYVDFNRCGTPLAEIVSEPDIRDPKEAYAYLNTLKEILLDYEVSDCNMEEGSLRCDANVSVRLRGSRGFGTKVEVKNLNSFRYLEKALEYERQRQIRVLESGNRLSQETRLWNQAEGRTVSMRSKEKAHDYRYFPEPDLLPVYISAAWREEVLRWQPPESLADMSARFVSAYGITPYDAGVLTGTRALADYFEAVVKAGAAAKSSANWMQTELLRRLNDSNKEVEASPVSPASLAELVKLVDSGRITGAVGKKVLSQMFDTRKSAPEIIREMHFDIYISYSEIEKALANVLLQNLRQLDQFKDGKAAVKKFLLGHAMKRLRGQADPVKLEAELDLLLSMPKFANVDVAKPDLFLSMTKLANVDVKVQTTIQYPVLWKAVTVATTTQYPELWKAVTVATTTKTKKVQPTESLTGTMPTKGADQ